LEKENLYSWHSGFPKLDDTIDSSEQVPDYPLDAHTAAASYSYPVPCFWECQLMCFFKWHSFSKGGRGLRMFSKSGNIMTGVFLIPNHTKYEK
jgi:hypothetical protein